MIILGENNEPVWKFRDGTIVPVSKLTDKQLKECRNTALKNVDKHFQLMNLFTDLTNNLEAEMTTRIRETESKLQYLLNGDLSEIDEPNEKNNSN
jgi:hypothetical protein